MLTDELRDLYQDVILDHQETPRNFHELSEATHSADGYNPLCGDRVKLFVRLDGETIEQVSFHGAGCAISTASASMLTEQLKGKTVDQAKRMIDDFRELVTGTLGEAEHLGDLQVLAGVREFPTRVKCATLAWHTLDAALNQRQDAASTE